MICVAGFNSAVDRFATADTFRAGAVNRLSSVRAYPGGKGVHVAQAAALARARVRLVGVVDGEHRKWFENALAARGVEFCGVPIAHPIRTCVAVRDAAGNMTELLEPGPPLAADEATTLEAEFLSAAASARVVVMSGSLPRGLATDFYARLVNRLKTLVPHVVVDTSGAALAEAVLAGPTVVKPNRDEAAMLLGRPVSDAGSAMEAARHIARNGVPRVVVSLGADGAVVAWDGRAGRVHIEAETPVSAVGSGDCFVGGLAAALARGDDVDDALRLGAACSIANTRSDEPGHFDPRDVDGLVPRVRITWQ